MRRVSITSRFVPSSYISTFLCVTFSPKFQGMSLLTLVRQGHNTIEQIVAFVRDHPEYDLNLPETEGTFTAFMYACGHNQIDVIRALVHFFPGRLDLNQRDSSGWTPVMFSCVRSAFLDVAKFLICHPDVRLDVVTNAGDCILHLVGANLELLRWVLATNKPLTLNWAHMDDRYSKAPSSQNLAQCRAILEGFHRNEGLARHQARLEIGPGPFDARWLDTYAIMIFISDGLLQMCAVLTLVVRQDTGRFFGMGQRLPLDLQMVLCRRLVGSGRAVIAVADAEPAFQHLASQFLP